MASELLAARDPDGAAEDENGGAALETLLPRDDAIGGSDDMASTPAKVRNKQSISRFFLCVRSAPSNPYFEDLDLHKETFWALNCFGNGGLCVVL